MWKGWIMWISEPGNLMVTEENPGKPEKCGNLLNGEKYVM